MRLKTLINSFKTFAVITLLIASTASAEESKALKWYDKLSTTGYVDTYYQLNLNGLSGGSNGNINSLGVTRVFDSRQNEFSFSGAKLSLTTTDEATKVGGQLDLLYGPVAAAAVGSLVEQAFVSFPFGPVSVKFGKMVTHLGYEVIEIPANLNYSRSLLFNQVPFYHVGVMANYTVLEELGIMLGAVNGNSFEQANDETKDLAAQITYSKLAGLSLIGNYYLESNRTAAGLQPFENTHYLEFIANYQAWSTLGLSLDYLYKTTIAAADKDVDGNLIGDSFSPKTQGYALYANYTTPIPGFSVIPRFEQLYQPDSYALAFDYTLTLKYAVGPLTHYLELRSDVAYPGVFEPSSHPATTSEEMKRNQLTLTYGATYTF